MTTQALAPTAQGSTLMLARIGAAAYVLWGLWHLGGELAECHFRQQSDDLDDLFNAAGVTENSTR